MDALLHKAGVITRVGRPEEKNTVSDYEADEKERGHSIYSSLCHFNYNGIEINLADVPGGMDFFGNAVGPFHAADMAIIAIDAVRGVEVNTRRFVKLAQDVGIPCVFVVNRMDVDHANFNEAVAGIQESFGVHCKPFAFANANGPTVASVTTILDDPKLSRARSDFVETAVEADDELLERYLEGEELTQEMLNSVIPKAMLAGKLYPVMPLSLAKDVGIDTLLDFIVRFAPPPTARAVKVLVDNEEKLIKPAADGAALGFVFKTIIDPFVGRINYFRVLSGVLPAGGTFFTAENERAEKSGAMFKVVGKDQHNVEHLMAGDIGAVSKMDTLGTAGFISTEQHKYELAGLKFPSPMVALAIEPLARGDEAKMFQSLRRIGDEDPTFKADRNRQTKELVVNGMGTLHIDLMLNKLKAKYGVKVITRQPKVPYLETITGRAETRYRHKKQTGGAGQFGEVAIKIEPNERGKGFNFVDEIVGGVVPGQFIPSVEKGIAAVMEEGVLAGYPVVDVTVRLWDGKSHPVDSKDIAFQVAGREAFKQAVTEAKPTFLEPIGMIEVTVPNEFMGDIISDLNPRRGRIIGSESQGNFQVIKAEVPYAEVANYSNDLRSMTQGVGTYTLEFLRYEVVPSHMRDAIIAQAQKEREAAK